MATETAKILVVPKGWGENGMTRKSTEDDKKLFYMIL
jgi:hypothetical protein